MIEEKLMILVDAGDIEQAWLLGESLGVDLVDVLAKSGERGKIKYDQFDPILKLIMKKKKRLLSAPLMTPSVWESKEFCDLYKKCRMIFRGYSEEADAMEELFGTQREFKIILEKMFMDKIVAMFPTENDIRKMMGKYFPKSGDWGKGYYFDPKLISLKLIKNLADMYELDGLPFCD